MSIAVSPAVERKFYWKEDLLASLVVFLVALPLSLGLALVAGYPFEKAAAVGLISGAVGGIVVGLLSGSPLQVSGAANGAAVTVAAFASEYGLEVVGVIVLLAGLMQIAAGAFRLGPVFRAVSPALIQGMLAGIGVLIFASQFHVMVDDTPPGTGKEFGGLVNLWSLTEAVWKGLTNPAHSSAAWIGLFTIVLIVAWTERAPKFLRKLPAPLVGVGVATFIAWAGGLDVKYVPTPDRLADAIAIPSLSAFERLSHGAIWTAALTLAFVASAESLLTAGAIDALQRHAPRSKYNKELVAQGVGNAICGALGVLPVSGVIVRSSANVMAGARTRLSTVLHGVWILLFVVLLPDVLRMIPVASLAAVLVYAGAKLIKLGVLRNLWSVDRVEAGVYLATMATVVATDVLTGIALGVVLALARLIYTFTHLDIAVRDNKLSGVTEIELTGAATFVRLPQLAAVLEGLSPDAHVQVHVRRLNYIDHACLDLLLAWRQQHESVGGHLVLDMDTLQDVFRQKGWANGDSVARAEATTG